MEKIGLIVLYKFEPTKNSNIYDLKTSLNKKLKAYIIYQVNL